MIVTFFSSSDSEHTITKVYNKAAYGSPLFLYMDENIEKKFYISVSYPVCKVLIKSGEKIKSGEAVALVDTSPFNDYISKKELWNFAISVNAAFKGLLASMGESGQIAEKTLPVHTELSVDNGIDKLICDIANSVLDQNIEEGDVVVIAEKPFPVAERRLIPQNLIMGENDPKNSTQESRKQLIRFIKNKFNFELDEADLIMCDMYSSNLVGDMATVGASDHNKLAHECAEKIKHVTGKNVDVVISDTDTGADIAMPIIDTITIAATPVGATKGLSIYETMRAACASEFIRGSKKRIPIVICKPVSRCRVRKNIGLYRGYAGKISFYKEGTLLHEK